MRFFVGIFLFFNSTYLVLGQHKYNFNNSIPVTNNGQTLTMPFAGGLLAPQFNTIDLDLDGNLDLFVFDRSSNKISTFLYTNGTYEYAPYYESLFPKNLEHWVLLRDYNCDGKPDLFTSSIFGMSVYKNTSVIEVSWELAYQTVYTQGANGQVNLQVNSGDLPAIEDVDMDGDLDILVFNFALGGGVEFHKNLAVENGLPCDLELKRETRTYGNFKECTCDTYSFAPDDCNTGGKLDHIGGKSILSFPFSNSNVQDLVIGQENCPFPGYLPNSGSVQAPEMTSVNFDFPVSANPLRIKYPAFFYIDLYNDGIMDLLAAYNKFTTDGTIDVSIGPFQYAKTSNTGFTLVTDAFLTNQMIDKGAFASTAFTDIDFDGDVDMLIASTASKSGVSLFQNSGSIQHPEYTLLDEDYLSINSMGFDFARLQFIDLTNDGWQDLVVYGTKNGTISTWVFTHSGNPLVPYSKDQKQLYSLPTLSTQDYPWLVSLSDTPSLLVGTSQGTIKKYTSANFQSPNWQLVDDTYLGLEPDFNHRSAKITTGDVDSDGKLDLLKIDRSGTIYVYSNFESNPSIDSVTIASNATENSYTPYFGIGATLALAPVTNNTQPLLAIGLTNGGVQLLENTGGSEKDPNTAIQLVIFPNPASTGQGQVQVNQPAWWRILNTAGQEVMAPMVIKANQPTPLPLWLTQGLYIIQAYDINGASTSKLLVVSN